MKEENIGVLSAGERFGFKGFESYNQKRTVQLNYAVLKNIYHARRNHKLDEWHTFCHFIESLPHSELITE